MNYMGIDHHKQYSQMTLMDEDGKELRNDKVLNFRSEVEKFLQGAGEEVKAVIEAGRSSYVMVDLLEELGVEVKIANPKEVKAIAKAKIKTDKRDSRILAHLLRADLIPEVYQRTGENRRRQRVLRQRAFFVAMRTRVKNKTRALLAQQKEEIQGEVSRVKNLFSRKGLETLKGLGLPDTDKALLDGLLKMYQQLEERIKESDELVERLYNKIPEAQLVSTVPGFGKFFSVLVATEIADVGRFSRVERLHSYAGVIPSTHSTGERHFHGKITKEGNAWLRWAAVEAVWPAIKSDFDLKVFYERLARRKNTNAAKVATARRLLTIIYRILKERRSYVPYKR
jgi:transposase